ncbi:excisionase [Mesorhizobium xinjiangense]|uniref:excisionase n=1 Tax=Mesorhizobium xinjiangense TaxID=2678685 RepID=UPI0012EDB16D|nr:excisionase [Mesorhizobium xinjiangense]
MTVEPICDFDKDALIRIDRAVKIAFPDGTMTAKGLRRERDAGRLETHIIARKEYVTLAAIDRMIELCRVQPRVPASSGERKAFGKTGQSGARPGGGSETERISTARAAAMARLQELKKNSRRTSTKS